MFLVVNPPGDMPSRSCRSCRASPCRLGKNGYSECSQYRTGGRITKQSLTVGSRSSLDLNTISWKGLRIRKQNELTCRVSKFKKVTCTTPRILEATIITLIWHSRCNHHANPANKGRHDHVHNQDLHPVVGPSCREWR